MQPRSSLRPQKVQGWVLYHQNAADTGTSHVVGEVMVLRSNGVLGNTYHGYFGWLVSLLYE